MSGHNNKLKIWYISAYDQPEGHSSRTYDYATALTGIGHKVTMFTNSFNHFTREERLAPHEKFRKEWFGAVRVIWLKTIPYSDNGWGRGLNMLSNVWQAYRIGRRLKERPDVIVGPSVPIFTALSAYLLALTKHCPFIFEVRDIWPQALIDFGLLSPHSPVTLSFRMVEKFLYRKAAHIFAGLPLTYLHVGQSGCDPSKVTWIPNGVNLERFQENRTASSGKSGKLVAMYIGGFTFSHGVKTILESAEILQNNGNNVRFILVGRGRAYPYFQELVRKMGLLNIEFRDIVPKSEIANLQNEADLLIASVKNSIRFRFGLNSNKICDYLASGRPILFAGDTPNDPVAESGAGISIPPENPLEMANAIQRFSAMSPAERQKFGQRGRNYIEENLDIRKLAKTIENIIYNVSDRNYIEN